MLCMERLEATFKLFDKVNLANRLSENIRMGMDILI